MSKLTLLTLNAFGAPRSLTGRIRLSLLDKFIAETEPDCVALQEVIFGWQRRILEEGLKQLGYEFYPKKHSWFKGGLLFISRLPVKDFRFEKFEDQGPWKLYGLPDRIIGKGFQIIELEGISLAIIHAHLLPAYGDGELRTLNNQLKQIIKSARTNKRFVIAGDLNTSPNSEAYKRIVTECSLYDPLCKEAVITVDPVNLNRKVLTKRFKAIRTRYDYALIHGVEKSSVKQEVVLTEPVEHEGRKYHLSDHYGILTTIKL